MAKRRASGAEDDPDVSEAEETPQKRARVAEEEEKELEESEEQKEFEARHAGEVRASIEKKTKLAGRIAEQGIIQSLEMHQFMCHPRLSFTFGPQINFIIGHNGSGKSAVLSAITVALGGKATSTGRGSGLKSFIREGQNAAEVTITIKNEGEDAYRPAVYGKSIVISRRFTKEGSSSYKIKSKEGKTISTKKEELSAICDHMNIQVDNPMNILSQDSARQFLSSSHPQEKYEFFLKGTQLKQLSEEYETILENITKTFKVLDAKRQVLPDLKKAAQQARERYKGAQKAIETKEKARDLKEELAWSWVKEKEKEMSDGVNEVARATRKLPRIEESLVDARAKLEEVNNRITELEGQRMGLGDITHLNAKSVDINEQLKRNKGLLRGYMADIERMNADTKRHNKTIAELQIQIDRETKKLQEDKQAEREERRRRIDAAKNDYETAHSQLSEAEDGIRTRQERSEQLTTRTRELQNVASEALNDMKIYEANLNQLQQKARDQREIYGTNVSALLQRIKETRWHGDMPIGPLGACVSLRDQKWAALLRAVLGNMMTSFAITDGRDRNTLKQLLNSTNNPHTQIIVSAKDIFDYSSGEPPRGIMTILRVLDFKDPLVERIFINQNRIERILLAESRIEGEQLAESLGGGVAMTADLARIQVQAGGGYYSTPITEVHPKDPKSRYFQHADPEKEKQHWKAMGREADARHQTAMSEANELKNELSSVNRELMDLKRTASKLHDSRHRAKQRQTALQEEANEDVPVNISALESSKQDMESEKESIRVQFEAVVEKKSELDAEQKELLEEKNQIQQQILMHTREKSVIDDEIFRVTDERTQAEQNVKHWDKKRNEQQAKIDELNQKANRSQAEYEEWSRSAETLCDGRRVENPRPRPEVERQCNSVEKALAEQEKENGASIEELEEQLADAIRKYESTQKDIQDIANLNKALKASMNMRTTRWHDFRRHIALRTKMLFQYHLSKRAYFGKVIFEHDKQRLELKVQTDDLAATQGMNKDPRSLSGGEKSFATICLLLSLWEAIGCPLRCLDEFDVFMDAVNRRISMRMMIETANASDSKQYILITPQDMSNVASGPSVRVHRMGDPERGQGALAFT